MRSRIEFIFDKVAQEISSKKNDISPIKTLLESCQLQNKSVLEVGCGMGDNLIYCVQRGAGYAEGFDISGKSIELAQSKAKNLSNIIFHQCSLEEYKAERRFDLILCLGVFEYLNDPLESLKKICCLLKDEASLILLISKPIFIKRVSFLCRAPLSKLPLKMVLPVARFIGGILQPLNPVFKKIFYAGQSNTYTIKRTILESLMVPKYNIFYRRIFNNYLSDEGFSTEFFNDLAPSVIGIIAKKNSKQKQ